MSDSVVKYDERGILDGATVGLPRKMTRDIWLQEVFPEWGTYLNYEIDQTKVKPGDRGDVVFRRPVLRPEIPGRSGVHRGPVCGPEPFHGLFLLRRLPDQRRGQALLDAPEPPCDRSLEVQAARRGLHHPPSPGPHGFLHHLRRPADHEVQIHRPARDLPADEEEHGRAGRPHHRGRGGEEHSDRRHEGRCGSQLRRHRDQDRLSKRRSLSRSGGKLHLQHRGRRTSPSWATPCTTTATAWWASSTKSTWSAWTWATTGPDTRTRCPPGMCGAWPKPSTPRSSSRTISTTGRTATKIPTYLVDIVKQKNKENRPEMKTVILLPGARYIHPDDQNIGRYVYPDWREWMNWKKSVEYGPGKI